MKIENTVKAENQLKKDEFVLLKQEDSKKKGLKVLFVGNSMTLHGVNKDIGWNHHWGMAASAEEKDYVHVTMKKIRQHDEHAVFCICQVAEWERRYKEGTEVLDYYENARLFDADIIIMRFIENCPSEAFDSQVFQERYKELLGYLNPTGRAKIVITTGFWRHVGDEAICEFAEKNGFPLVELGDLGEQEEMMAFGLFEHKGVAAHPGDLGMEHMADRIYRCMVREGMLSDPV